MTSEHNRQALRPTAGGMMTVKFADEIARLKSTAEWKTWSANSQESELRRNSLGSQPWRLPGDFQK